MTSVYTKATRFLTVATSLCIALGVRGAEPDPMYVGARKCGVCHKKELIGNQLAAWRHGPHAGAFETLRSERSSTIASESGLVVPPHLSPRCLECHSTGAMISPRDQAFRLDLADGVQCEACHGPGSRYRKKKIMSDLDRARALGLLDVGNQPALCRTCHNPRSPTFDPERYVLPNGEHVGFDFEQAKSRIEHPIPPEVKGRYLELSEEE